MGKGKVQGAYLFEPSPDWQAGSTIKNIEVFQPGSHESDAETVAKKPGDELKAARGMKDYNTVGRPTNGIIAKPNTHAFVQVLDANGSVLSCFNNIGLNNQSNESREELLSSSGYYLSDRVVREEKSLADAAKEKAAKAAKALGMGKDTKPPADIGGNNLAPMWTDWILQSVHESRVEKTQVVETFGDSYFYVFGQRPRSIAISGLLMNTQDYNWRSIFWKNWDEFFRATKLVEKGATLYLQWDDIIVAGYPVNAMCNEVADSPNAMRFSFNLFVTDYINISAQGGFLSQRYMRIAQLRSGSGLGYINRKKGWSLLGGEGFNPRSYNYRKSDPNALGGTAGGGLFGAEGYLGLRRYDGAQFQKFSLSESVLSGQGLANIAMNQASRIEDNAFMRSRTGQSLRRNLGFLVSKGFYNLLNGGSWNSQKDIIARTISANSMFRQISQDIATSAIQDLTDLAEDGLDVRRGELNRWLNFFNSAADNFGEDFGQSQAESNGALEDKDEWSQYQSFESMVAGFINTGIFGSDRMWGGEYVDSQGVVRTYGNLEGGVIERRWPGAVVASTREELEAQLGAE